MANTTLVGRNFDLGFQSDLARDQLPRGAAYRMRDWIPQDEAALRKRGGWAHASRDLNGLSAAVRMSGVGWAPFAGDPHLISLSEGGKLYQHKTFDSSSGSFVGATSLAPLTHNPFWHRDRMIVLQGLGAAAATPKKYYDTGGTSYAVADLGGTPPQATVGASWGDYLLLANGYVGGTRYPQRVWPSGVGDPESWNPGAAFFDAPQEVVKILPLRTVIIVWGYENTWMYTGDTPPGAGGGNLARRDLFSGNGCMDGRSVASYREYVIWANNAGVWKTDGATLTNLTYRGGISLYWKSLVSSFNFQTGWSAAGGVYYGHYLISIHNSSGQLVTTLVCDLETETWFEWTNVRASMYASRSASAGTAAADGHEELFFANRALPRVEDISPCWTPTASNASDADGVDVEPELDLPFYVLGSPGMKRVRRAYVKYDLRGAGGSPTLTVSTITSPEATVYTARNPVLKATTQMTRKAVDIRKACLGVGLSIVQSGPSADTRISDIEFEAHPWESSH